MFFLLGNVQFSCPAKRRNVSPSVLQREARETYEVPMYFMQGLSEPLQDLISPTIPIPMKISSALKDQATLPDNDVAVLLFSRSHSFCFPRI